MVVSRVSSRFESVMLNTVSTSEAEILFRKGLAIVPISGGYIEGPAGFPLFPWVIERREVMPVNVF